LFYKSATQEKPDSHPAVCYQKNSKGLYALIGILAYLNFLKLIAGIVNAFRKKFANVYLCGA